MTTIQFNELNKTELPQENFTILNAPIEHVKTFRLNMIDNYTFSIECNLNDNGNFLVHKGSIDNIFFKMIDDYDLTLKIEGNGSYTIHAEYEDEL